MAFSGLSEFKTLFSGGKAKSPYDKLFKVAVVDFLCSNNLDYAKHFYNRFAQNPMFEMVFVKDNFAKSFLNFQGRNFFEFIEKGNKILRQTHSDIVIWGYEEYGKIRLNFQTPNQYNIPNDPTFSLLDSLFLPLNYLTDAKNLPQAVAMIIEGIIVAGTTPVTNLQKKHQAQILSDIIKNLAKDSSPKDISREFMPYIMNMLGKLYLINNLKNLNANDVKIMADLFETALKNKQYMRLPIYYGIIYANMGQLYEQAYMNESKNPQYLRLAISYYQSAQKSMGRNYQYDFGSISYHLGLMHFEFWKYGADLQALRDAVFYLREAEKIYVSSQFPRTWCHIEGLLGNYLTSLGMNADSPEIMQMAINSYKQQQKLYVLNEYPLQWAELQEKIGNVFYLLGKAREDDNFMLEAKNYFNSAIGVYKEMKLKDKIVEAKRNLDKVHNYIQ
ncbi:MAG: hypothetical protein IKO06_03930 [Alphaproteobacteria bacterium]|nr:hypothetical protein [Alphaproteobacteria bacterium]